MVVPVVGTNLVVLRQGQRYFSEDYARQLGSTFTGAQRAVNLSLNTLDRSLRVLASNRDVIRTAILGSDGDLLHVRAAVDAMSQLSTTFDLVLSVYLYTSHDGIVLTSDGARVELREFYDRTWLGELDTFFLGTLKTEPRVIFDSNRNSFHVLSFIEAVPRGTWDTDGFLVVNILVSQLATLLDSDPVADASMFVVNEVGTVLSHPSSSHIGRSLPEVQSVLGNGYIFAETSLELSPWSLVLAASESTHRERLQYLARIVAFLTLAWVAVGVGIAYIAAARLYVPVSHLTSVFALPAKASGYRDEIGQAEQAYLELSNDRDTLITENAQLQTAAQQHEIAWEVFGAEAPPPPDVSSFPPHPIVARRMAVICDIDVDVSWSPILYRGPLNPSCQIAVLGVDDETETIAGALLTARREMGPVGLSEVTGPDGMLTLLRDQALAAYRHARFAGFDGPIRYGSLPTDERATDLAADLGRVVAAATVLPVSPVAEMKTMTEDLLVYATAVSERSFRREVAHAIAQIDLRQATNYVLEMEHCVTARHVLALFNRVVSERYGRDLSQTPQSAHVNRMQEFIEQNYQSDIGLNDAAEFAGISLAYASTLFKRETGSSFVDFVGQVRVSHAMGMLKSGSSNVASVASECGFLSVQSFIRTFKRHVGMTPGRFHDANGGSV